MCLLPAPLFFPPRAPAAIVDKAVTDPWLRAFLDLECFVLSGMTAKDTIAAGAREADGLVPLRAARGSLAKLARRASDAHSTALPTSSLSSLSSLLFPPLPNTEMAFMFHERHNGKTPIQYPIGGSHAIIDALVRGA